jgi:hypothetical protein
MRRRCIGLAAVMFAMAAASAAPATAATVTVRVEGAQQTLVPKTTVTTSPGTFPVRDGGSCSSTSAGGALQLATGGDWGGRTDAQGQRVETIRGETYLLGAEYSGRYWSVFVNHAVAQAGICALDLQDGDQLLLEAACGGATDACFGDGPLDLIAPTTVRPGEPFAVHVDEYAFDQSFQTVKADSIGATVSAAGTTTSTDAAGNATVTLTARGSTVLTVGKASSKGAFVRDSEPVCVTDGSDGACGSSTAPSTCATTGDDGLCGTKDKRPPRGKILSIREGQRFGKGKGPRGLSGIVTSDPSGIADVRLRLTRNDHGRCQTFDGRSERLVSMKRCGAKRGKWFSAGDREQWSYLLPARLGSGRYVLDLQARDRAGNVDTLLQRTRTRVVFTVS